MLHELVIISLMESFIVLSHTQPLFIYDQVLIKYLSILLSIL